MKGSLYPFISNTLKLGSYKYHYLDEGQGDPLVMVHGNPTWSFYYRNLIIELNICLFISVNNLIFSTK